MISPKPESIAIRSPNDVASARQRVRARSAELGFSIVDQTKLVTAASELARNALIYGGGGTMLIETLLLGSRRGVRLTFEDQGPGIADLELALSDGYSTGGGLGMGLSGSRRLVNEFEIESTPNQGTKVRVVKWH